VKGHGATALAAVDPSRAPKPSLDHSRTRGATRVPVQLGLRPVGAVPAACDESPLAGYHP
jgi:hypothetical protein